MMSIRRACFDIGSGSSKLQVADVLNGRIIKTIFTSEQPLTFGFDYKKSVDGTLSKDIQDRGTVIMTALKEKADSLDAMQFSAVATEVFRRASNGQQYLSRLEKDLKIPVVMVSQDVEAEIGFKTVIAIQNADMSSACVWDSGGASFQITSVDPSSSKKSLRTYMGRLGTSVTTNILIEQVLQKDFLKTHTANPVSDETVNMFLSALTAKLDPVPDWLFSQRHVFAASGINSLFKLCCDILTIDSEHRQHKKEGEILSQIEKEVCSSKIEVAGSHQEKKDEETNSKKKVEKIEEGEDYKEGESKSSLAPVTKFSLADAELALKLCVGKTDEQLLKYQMFENAEGPHVIIPKLALLVAVMRHCKIDSVQSVRCVGSCAGVLISEEFWKA